MPKNNLSSSHHAFFDCVSGDEGGAVADGGGGANYGHGGGIPSPGMTLSS